MSDQENATVVTTAGRVRGEERDGILHFLGVPYGESTGGEYRFLPPRPRAPWEGTFDATQHGPDAPQDNPEPLTNHPAGLQSEDCLVLNVWTPAADDRKRPVMFWLHGGGFVSGSGNGAMYDGSHLARRGDVVVVGINHRLGALGFLPLMDVDPAAGDTANAGMRDIILALEWARDNVARFGGDPGNVTIFGESGGGRKVSALLAMPRAAGLFHKGIIESGASVFLNDREACANLARVLLAELEITAEPLKSLQSMPVERILEAQAAVTRKLGRRSPGLIQTFAPVVDGDTLPSHPFDPAGPALSDGIPLIVGYNHTEATFMLRRDPDLLEVDDARLEARVAKLQGEHAASLIARYRARYPGATNADILAYIATGDLRYPIDAITLAARKAERKAAPVYFYTLTWRTPASRGSLRTPHTLELPFVFDNVATSRGLVGGGDDPQRLADQFSESWIAFARTGDPNNAQIPEWPPYDLPARQTMLFDLPSRVESDFGAIERQAWEPIFYAQ